MKGLDLRRFAVRKSLASIDAALRCLVRTAYRTVPLVQARLDSVGIDPLSIRSRTDLRALPIVCREDYVSRPLSASLRRGADPACCYKSSTSGTTGVPLDVYMSHAEAAYRKLVLFNAIRRNTKASLPFRIVEVGTGEVGIAMRRRVRRLDPIRVTRIPRSLPVDEQLKRLLSSAPQVITGHPSCIEAVAEALDHRPAGFAPRLVVCRGELLRDRTRALLRERLGCKVVDYYSCDEIGNIAWECPVHPRRMHVSTDGCIVEIADEGGTPTPVGEEGSILVTNLFNHTMPFIRYRLGDLGRASDDGPCVCGHDGPSLHLVAGREDDSLWLANGRRMSPRVLDTQIAMALIASEEGAYYAKCYQCIQETVETFRVLVVREDDAPADLGDRIRRRIEESIPGSTCRVEWVDSIAPDPSGKRRLIVSNVRAPSASAPVGDARPERYDDGQRREPDRQATDLAANDKPPGGDDA